MIHRRICLLALCLALLCAGITAAAEEPTQPGAVSIWRVCIKEPPDQNAYWSNMLLGECVDGAFYGIDLSKIYHEGQPISEERLSLLYELPDGVLVNPINDYASVGQTMPLYDSLTGAYITDASVRSLYFYQSGASGNTYLCAVMDPLSAVPEGEYFSLSKPGNPVPRPVQTADDGSRLHTSLTVDMDQDGTVEQIVWNYEETLGESETLEHPVHILRNGVEFATIPFFYDGDYTHPNPPQLLDFNGDGIYELVLSATGHNSYIRIYAWRDGAFERTDIGFYLGD